MVRRRSSTLSLCLAIVLALIIALEAATSGPVHTAPLTVTRTDEPAPNGCAAGDWPLREAITAANGPGGPMITLPAGT